MQEFSNEEIEDQQFRWGEEDDDLDDDFDDDDESEDNEEDDTDDIIFEAVKLGELNVQ